MNLSHLTLRRLTQDLQACVGARIQDACLGGHNELILEVSRVSGAKTTRIFISASRENARICIDAFPDPAKPHRTPWIERYLVKSGIRSIHLAENDRIITFDLDKQDRVGSRYPSRLIVEMMGRDSNALIVDDSEKVQGVLRNHTSEHRKIHSGAVYKPPRPQQRALPKDIAPTTFQAELSENAPLDVLMQQCAGMDRNLAAELIHRAEHESADLLDYAKAWYQAPPFNEQSACLLNPQGARTAALSFTPKHLDADKYELADSISIAIDLVYQDSLKKVEKRGEKRDLVRSLKRAIKTAKTKCERIEDDLTQSKKADELEQMGSLILSQPHEIEQGASEVTLDNLFAENQQLTILLNPKQSATENGQAYLKKAAKARKSQPVLERRLGQSKEKVVELEDLLGKLETITDEEATREFRKTLEDRGVIRPKRVKPKQGKPDPSGLHPRRYRTSDGWEVWVGRNDQENDRITKSAPRNAIWFHAYGCPGSHVVLRPWDQREPSREALQDAACLAAYWSKARGSKTVAVNYTEARYVQKPKGAPPGLVTIKNEKTLFVAPREIAKWESTENWH